MNFKKFNDIGDSEPRGWSSSVGTKFTNEDEDEDELAVPYCDEFEDEEEETDEEELLDENETETETESIDSRRGALKRNSKRGGVPLECIVLQEEVDFKEE
jgi:hypothetical protein